MSRNNAVLFVIVLVMVLALATLPAAAAPTPPGEASLPSVDVPRAAALNPEFMGMAIRDPWYEFNTNPEYPNAANEAFQGEMGATLERAGVRWVRLEMQIRNGDPAFEMTKHDYFINEVARSPDNDFRVLVLLGFNLVPGNPRLLNTGPFTVTSKYGGGVNQYMKDWLDRALMIADHYGDNIAAYEILNEENRLPQYQGEGPAGDAIMPNLTGRLITKFYRFCKGIDVPPDEPAHGCANAKIILGGIHPRGTTDAKGNTIWTDAQYLTTIYTDTTSFAGFQNNLNHPYYPVDGIAYHPYPEEIRLSPNNLEVDRGLLRMRRALEAVGDPFKPFWVTEVGYNVGQRVNRVIQTEAGQAAFMRDVYTTLSARQLSNGEPEVANVFWFKYEDFPPATGPNAQQWGIVRIAILEGNCEGGCYDPSGRPLFYRQSFWIYRELAGLPVYRVYLSTAGKS